MVLLTYSRGRGRASPGRGGSFSNTSYRGRGGRSGGGRGRSMTWTNPSSSGEHQQQQQQQQQHISPASRRVGPSVFASVAPPPAATATSVSGILPAALPRVHPTPKLAGHRVWVNSTASGAGSGEMGVVRHTRNIKSAVNNTTNTDSNTVPVTTDRRRSSSPPSKTATSMKIASSRSVQRSPSSSSSRISPPRPLEPVVAAAPYPLVGGMNTSKAGNRVWTNNNIITAAADASLAKPATPLTAVIPPPAAGAIPSSSNKNRPLLRSAPQAAAQVSKRARSGTSAPRNVNLVWTKTGGGGAAGTPTAGNDVGSLVAGTTMVSGSPFAEGAATAVATKGQNSGRVKPIVPAFSGAINSTSATGPPSRQSVSRYSSSASWQLKTSSINSIDPRSSTARGGRNSSKQNSAGRVARYSLTRGAKGGKPPAERFAHPVQSGTGMRKLRGEASTGGYSWSPGSRRSVISWRGGRSSSYVGGRGGDPSRLLTKMRFAYPASRWTKHLAPWTGGVRGRSVPTTSRPRPPPSSKIRFKNRSLIRVRRILPPQQPVAKTAYLSVPIAATAAVARRAVIARSSSLAAARSVLGLKARATPTTFVRSGMHGMTLRRVRSSDLAAQRATVSSPSVNGSKTGARCGSAAVTSSAGEARRVDKKSTPPAATSVQAAKPTTTATATTAAAFAKRKSSTPPRASGSNAIMPKLALRKAALLLTKTRVRSIAKRKAAAVVAGARVKKARITVRNMTLYRRKGEVSVARLDAGAGGTSSGGAAGGGKEASAKKKVRVKTEPCLFFCKFGKCSNSEEKCRYIHDKSKVAVCRAFLRGKCEKRDSCLLTHAIQSEKMPVCVHFERGLCFTPNCPYLHVKVSRNAAVCPNFLKGHCPDGTTCRLKHELPDRRSTREASTRGDLGDGEANISSAEMKTGPSKTGAASSSASTGASASFPFEERSGKSGVRPSGATAGRGGGGLELVVSEVDRGSSRQGRVGNAAAPNAGDTGTARKRQEGEAQDSRGEDNSDDDLKPRFLRKLRKL